MTQQNASKFAIYSNPPNLLLYWTWTSSRILLDVQLTYFSATSMAAEAYALAHTVYWTSSRGYFSATGRPVEKNSTGRPVEQMIWAYI